MSRKMILSLVAAVGVFTWNAAARAQEECWTEDDPVCNDANPCTYDTCVIGVQPPGVCQHTPLEDGAPCNDGDLCTAVDKCEGGVCIGGPADGCIQMELRVAGDGPNYVGDVIDVDLFVWGEGCAPPPGPCGGGTIQPVQAMEVMLGWDPAVVELAHPDETGEPNPEDPCDDPDSCNYDCGEPNVQYNWIYSGFPNDCIYGDGINAPCPPPEPPPDFDDFPANDGDAHYVAFMQIICDGEQADPACVAGYDAALKVTTFKYKALAPTAGVSDPTTIGIVDCIGQSRTFVVMPWARDDDQLLGTIGPPVPIEVLCVDGSDCPSGFCKPDGSCLASPPTPTVSQWGMVVMTLLVLSAGTVVMVRRRVTAT